MTKYIVDEVNLLRKKYVCLTGDFRAALILEKFVEWDYAQKGFLRRLQDQQAHAIRMGAPTDPIDIMRYEWLCVNLRSLRKATFLTLSKNTFYKLLKMLCDKEWLTRKPSQHNAFDRSYIYQVNLSKIHNDLLEIGFAGFNEIHHEHDDFGPEWQDNLYVAGAPLETLQNRGPNFDTGERENQVKNDVPVDNVALKPNNERCPNFGTTGFNKKEGKKEIKEKSSKKENKERKEEKTNISFAHMREEKIDFFDNGNYMPVGREIVSTDSISIAGDPEPTENDLSVTVGDHTGEDFTPTTWPAIPQERKSNGHMVERKGQRLHEELQLEPRWKSWAIDKGLTETVALEQFEVFKNYWLALPGRTARKLDWERTWRNHVLKAIAYMPKWRSDEMAKERNLIVENHKRRTAIASGNNENGICIELDKDNYMDITHGEVPPIWQTALKILAKEISPVQFKSYIRGLIYVGATGSVHTLQAPSNFVRDFIVNNFLGAIKHSLQDEEGNEKEIIIISK